MVFDGSSSTSCCHFVHKMDLSRPLTDNFARCFIDDGNDRIIYTTKKTASTHRPLTYARFDCPLTYARHSLNYHHRTYARHNLPLTYGRRYQWHPQTSTRCLLRLQLRRLRAPKFYIFAICSYINGNHYNDMVTTSQ